MKCRVKDRSGNPFMQYNGIKDCNEVPDVAGMQCKLRHAQIIGIESKLKNLLDGSKCAY